MSHWFAIMTPPQREYALRDILARRDFTVFLPIVVRYRRKNRYCRQKSETHLPLISRYLFVKLPPDRVAGWRELERQRLVDGVVGVAGKPYPIREYVMTAFTERVSAGEFGAPEAHRMMNTHQEFTEGDKVEIRTGPYQGQIVEVQSINLSKGRARFLLEIFGGTVPASARLEDLERAA